MAAMPRIMLSTAGPSITRNMLGKMNRTSGKMILTVVFAAFSSATYRRSSGVWTYHSSNTPTAP